MRRLRPAWAEALCLAEGPLGPVRPADRLDAAFDMFLEERWIHCDAGVDDQVGFRRLRARRLRQLRLSLAGDQVRDAEESFPQADRFQMRHLRAGGAQASLQIADDVKEKRIQVHGVGGADLYAAVEPAQ